jgi:hypothetical protein
MFVPPQRIRYHVTAPHISELEVAGAGRLGAPSVRAARLTLGLSDGGAIEIAELQAEAVDAHLSGAGTIRAAGAVDELDVDVPGAGSFEGRGLRSRVAAVRLSGVGRFRSGWRKLSGRLAAPAG